MGDLQTLGSCPCCTTEVAWNLRQVLLGLPQARIWPESKNTLSYSGALGDKTGSGSQGPQELAERGHSLSCMSFGEPGRPLVENHTLPLNPLESTSWLAPSRGGFNLSSKLL